MMPANIGGVESDAWDEGSSWEYEQVGLLG